MIKFSVKKVRERDIENKLVRAIKAAGGEAFKFSSPQNRGVPDRIILYKGEIYFVELKAPGRSLTPLQEKMIERFAKQGFKVYVINSFDKIDIFIHRMKRGVL